MIYIKYTDGYMRQAFDTVLGKFVGQEFIVGDQSKWGDEDGEPIDQTFWDDKEFGPDGPYLPYLDEEYKNLQVKDNE